MDNRVNGLQNSHPKLVHDQHMRRRYSVGDSRFCSLSPFIFSPNNWDLLSTSEFLYILKWKSTHMYLHMHTCTNALPHIHICACACPPTCVHAHKHTYTHMLSHMRAKEPPFCLAHTTPLALLCEFRAHVTNPELFLTLLVNIHSRHGWKGEESTRRCSWACP